MPNTGRPIESHVEWRRQEEHNCVEIEAEETEKGHRARLRRLMISHKVTADKRILNVQPMQRVHLTVPNSLVRTKNVRRWIAVLAATVSIATRVSAQDANDRATKMFDSVSHDFGVVAKGTQVSHRFKLTNGSEQSVHIASVTASCGCTTPECAQTLVKSHESTYIEVSMDTNRFQRQKLSTISVAFDLPQPNVVTLSVQVYIRPDIVVSPSSIDFGAVAEGLAGERRLSIAYTGRPDWKLTDARTNNRHLTARLAETTRTAGQVHYDLLVRLAADVPLGMIREQLVLLTNEPNGPEIPIPVEASIEPDVTLTPTIVQLGVLARSSQTTKTIVIRGRRPFAVKRIECALGPRNFKSPLLDDSTKLVHVLSVTFIAPEETGAFAQRFLVTVPGHAPLEFWARGIADGCQQMSIPK